MEEGVGIWSQLVGVMERRLGRLGPFITTTVFILAALAIALVCIRYVVGVVLNDVAPWVAAIDFPSNSTAVTVISGVILILAYLGAVAWFAHFLTQMREERMKRAKARIERAYAHMSVDRVLDFGPPRRQKLVLEILTDVEEHEDTIGRLRNATLPGYTPQRWHTTQNYVFEGA